MATGSELIGVTLDGRYLVTGLLGQGGMGQVYEGTQIALERKVAIKVLHPRLAHEERFRERFIREARSASRIRHPNVVQILDYGDTPAGSVYFTMEFLNGRDLRGLLRKTGALPWERARKILVQAVGALRAAHSKSIIHRDIKPGNCFLYDEPAAGRFEIVKLLDFGIAKIETEGDPHAKSLTGTGEVFGTASYMAPEQAYGATLDARSDIYSLGIMAYEVLVGNVPFSGVNAIHVITRHVSDVPTPPRDIDPSIPLEVEALILKAIHKRPEDRFASMVELEQALLAIPANAGVVSRVGALGAPWSGAKSPGLVPTGQTTIPRSPLTHTTAVIHAGDSAPPPASSLAPPVVQPGSIIHGTVGSEARGLSVGTEVVSGQLLSSATVSSSSSQPRIAEDIKQYCEPVAGVSLPPGELDVSTSPGGLIEPSYTGPLLRRSESANVGDTHPHFESANERARGPYRAALVLGLLVLLGAGAVVRGVVLSRSESATARLSGAEPNLVSLPVSIRAEVLVEPMAAEITSERFDDEQAAIIDIEQDDEDDLTVQDPVADVSPEQEIPSAEPTPTAGKGKQAGPYVRTAPRRRGSVGPSEPRPKTDKQVKKQLTRTVKRKCAKGHAGASVVAEITVGSNGSILFKSIQAPAGVKSCVLDALGKAEFAPGSLRKLGLDIQF